MSLALKFALAPLLVAQAIATRRRAPELPEAAGPRAGRIGTGSRSALRLLIAGDSSAAGVGVAEQASAVSGYLGRSLYARLGRPVDWVLRARTGLTTRQVHALLQAEASPPVDVAVVITGVNDVTRQLSIRTALRHRAALADWLLAEGRARHVLFAPLPPMGRFPLLPQPLRWAMGADARRHDAALARWSAMRPGISHIAIALELGPEVMAADGFHPGEPVYRICGEALAAHIADAVWPALERGTVASASVALRPSAARVAVPGDRSRRRSGSPR
jgi:lysophospholipase L1-like esterase